MKEKEKKFTDFLRRISPGSPLRNVIDDLIRSNLGGLIVVDSPNLAGCIEGGFKVNCKFTQQRLFELCKMDGAVILSSDLDRIIYGNAILVPDKNIISNETGTRHKSAEKIAKQAETFVIAISERRKKTTLFFCDEKHIIKDLEELLRTISVNLQVLEKEREQFDEALSKLNILEASNIVSVGDVCQVIQKAEIMLRISEPIKRALIELGKEGNILNLRFKELMKGVQKVEENIIRDYSRKSLKKMKRLLFNLSIEGITEPGTLSRLIFEDDVEKQISPLGIRLLSKLGFSEKEIASILKKVNSVEDILSLENEALESIFKFRAEKIKEEILKIKEEVLGGRLVL